MGTDLDGLSLCTLYLCGVICVSSVVVNFYKKLKAISCGDLRLNCGDLLQQPSVFAK